jgi:hypothetical protein
MSAAAQPLRVVHLNSLLTGGGTDDQCVKLAAQLHRLGQRVVIAGPGGRPFAPVVAGLGAPFFDTGARAGQFQFILRAAGLIRREKAEIVHGHHGRDIWPTIFAARLAGTRPKIVLTRHMAKSPSSGASRRFLLGQCDALIAVSEFVAKVLKEGAYEPQSPEEERRARLPLRAALTPRNSVRRTRRKNDANWVWGRGIMPLPLSAGTICPAGRDSANFWRRRRAFIKMFRRPDSSSLAAGAWPMSCKPIL